MNVTCDIFSSAPWPMMRRMAAKLPQRKKGQTLADWNLGDVGAIVEKFAAAKSVGLQLGVAEAKTLEKEKARLDALGFLTVASDTFPDLCEKMPHENSAIRNFRRWYQEEFYREFLPDEQAAELIASRSEDEVEAGKTQLTVSGVIERRTGKCNGAKSCRGPFLFVISV